MGVLTFPPRIAPDRPAPRLHVWRADDGYELHHESSTGESWAKLDRFSTREDALRAALDALPLYPGAKLGEVAA
jgi:hypothetical protein